LGLFAGLNVLPKKSYATAYSYRTGRDNQRALLAGWVRALSGLLSPRPEAFSLDFHAIPYRGDTAGLDRHYLPRRGKAGTSVLTFFALENDSRVLCYANANLTRADQPGEPMRFVDFWHELTGSDPAWLYIDSRVMTYPELSRLNQRGVWFVTIRRRGAAILRRLAGLPAGAWQKAVIDTPKRCQVTVGSYPWADLWIDGVSTGLQTPVVGLPISCGRHRLEFKRRDLKVDQIESVTVNEGHELKRQVDLQGAGVDE